jgi:regulator of sigma E protease
MEAEGPGILFSLAAFIGGFSLLVFIHEWGHYAVARLFKVRIETFSIGMGKEIWGRTDKNGTRWRFSAIPFGGYVKFFGDASAASNPGDLPDGLSAKDRADCFHFKPLWQRALVIFAGPAINLVAAVLILGGFAYIYGVNVSPPEIKFIESGSAAEKYGLVSGDIVRNINGKEIGRFSDIGDIVRLYPEKPVLIEIERQGAIQKIEVILGALKQQDRFGNLYVLGRLGVGPADFVHHELGIFGSLQEGARRTVRMGRTMFSTLGEMIIGLRSIDELGGPAKIAKVLGEAASTGAANFIFLLALLSLNLGIINLLPIPVLDGGHLMFYAMEAIKGSPVSKKVQEAGFIAGAALMLIFMVVVTLNDLQSMAS